MTSPLELVVMRRVRTVWAIRRFVGSVGVRIALVLLLLAVLALKISFPSVASNLLGLDGVNAYGAFAVAAFVGTSTVVQLLSLGILAAALWTCVGLVRSHKKTRTFIAGHAYR